MDSSLHDSERLDPDVDRATGGVPGDPLAEMLRQQSIDAEPVAAPRAAVIEDFPAGTFRFRTDPKYGRRKVSIKLRVYRPLLNPERDAIGLKRYEQWAARSFGDGNINEARKALKLDEEVFKRTGEYYIRFRPLRGRYECVFDTKDPLIAKYVRSRLDEFPFIYEDVRPMIVNIDGVDVEMVPATEDARRSLAAVQSGGN